MFTKKPILLLLTILLSLLLLNGTAAARATGAATSTGFTYQGRLTDDGATANGTYDFEFKLFDAISGGSQVGSADTQLGVPVDDGLFMVQLDFGRVFDGSLRYLEISVRPGGSADYTILDPRQALTAAPYATFAESPQNVVVVAKSGGDFTSIQAALDSIGDASAENPYQVYVAPGVYSEQVTMKPFVDIKGSGELTTKIWFYEGSDTVDLFTVRGASNAELSFLTVEFTNGFLFGGAIGVINNTASPRLTHVTINAFARGGFTKEAIGVLNTDSSSPMMTNVTISATSDSGQANGVFNENASSTMTNVKISATGNPYSYGIYNSGTTGSYTVVVNNSQISGSTATIYYESGYAVFIGASQLSGGNIITDGGTGSHKCIGVYDENYANLNGFTECP